MSRQATIKDVAARAGVSYQTVSKVLNHKIRVSRATEERIREAARAVGYRPNLVARSLRSRRSYMIGYSWAPSLPEQGNPILDLLLQGMVSASKQAGYHVLPFQHRPGDRWIEAYQEMIDANRVDGFVLSGVEYDDPRIQMLQGSGFPFVAFGRSNPHWDFPFVDVDGAVGMTRVVEHLVAQGHRKLAALAWSEKSRVGNNRMEGFLRGMALAGIDLHPEWIQRGEGVVQFGRQAAARLLDLPVNIRPSALVAFNDFMAAGAMQSAQARGLQVGTDLAITGFDDTSIAPYLTPALTSVRQPLREIGQRVIAMLVAILEQGETQEAHVLLQPELVVRQSSQSVQPESAA